MTPEETIERASRADKIVNDPLVVEAFAILRAAILETIEKAPVRDQEGVHECLLMLKVLASMKGHFEQAVRDGKVVLHRLEERKKFEAEQAAELRRISPAEFSAGHRASHRR